MTIRILPSCKRGGNEQRATIKGIENVLCLNSGMKLDAQVLKFGSIRTTPVCRGKSVAERFETLKTMKFPVE